MFLLLLVMFLFTPNTYKSTTPVTLRLLILERLRILTVFFTCNCAKMKQQKAEVIMIANKHVSDSSDKNFNS